MITLKNVTKRYGNIKALDNVDLQIGAGEMVLIVGTSGAGKSTLMRLLYREEKPSCGQINIANIDVSTLSPHKIPYLRRRMGIIFQDFKLLPDKTAFENVAYCLRALGTEEPEVQRRVIGALKLVGLYERANSFPHELSGGEQQRVGIARSIVQGPPLLIADEPTGNLDSKNGDEVMAMLRELNREGTTVIVVTHSEKEGNYADRLVRLLDGQVMVDKANRVQQTAEVA